VDEFDPSKIGDTELREFASRSDETERRSVIVELGLPAPRLELGKPWPLPRKGTVPETQSGVKMSQGDLADIEGNAKAMDILEKTILETGIHQKPVRLNAAQAFAIEVTPAQLRAISSSPLAGTIRRNRKHVVPPRG
jgi:hypothetical protein